MIRIWGMPLGSWNPLLRFLPLTMEVIDYLALSRRNFIQFQKRFKKKLTLPSMRVNEEAMRSSMLKFAWAIIDNKLFLWNFVTGSILFAYEEISEPIIKVEIATLKPDVFVSEMKHVLVIAIPSKILLSC